jgi:hypothetical protein
MKSQQRQSGNPLMRNFTGRLFSKEAAAAPSEISVSGVFRVCKGLGRSPAALGGAADSSLRTFQRGR